jgi:gamma-glutamylcyclotransferase (GGCT)/AIG2-like uncharacterized protein YtfP
MMPDEVVVPGKTGAASPDAEANGFVRHVFVYGTLRRGGSNDITRCRPLPQFVGHAHIAGTLYDLGAYPGAVLGVLGDASCGGKQRADHGGLVHGEIYRITKAVEAELDLLEEVRDDGGGEYVKREIELVLSGSGPRTEAGAMTLRCLVYEIHPSRVTGRAVVESGDWLRC